MDVSDLKGLFAEVKKRMDGSSNTSAASSAACAPAGRR